MCLVVNCSVEGEDPQAKGFIWVAAQGGFGIQTCAAVCDLAMCVCVLIVIVFSQAGRLAEAFALGEPVPADLADLGVTAAALARTRASLQ